MRTIRWVGFGLALTLLGVGALRYAAQPAAAETGGEGAMPASLRTWFDAHPVPPAAVRQALAKANGAVLPRAGAVGRAVPGRAVDAGVADAAGAPDAPQDTYSWVVDDFESAALDPALWTITDLDGDRHGDFQWGMSQCRASQGIQSLWSIGGGKDGSAKGCEDLYPSGANSSAMLVVDMSRFPTPPSQLDLLVDYWLNMRIFDESGVVPDGLFLSYLLTRPDGTAERVVLHAITSQYPERFFNDPMRTDMLEATEIYEPYRQFDLTQQPAVLLEFLFMSRDPVAEEPPPTTFMGGVFIDNVRMVSDVEPSAARTRTAGRLTVEPRAGID